MATKKMTKETGYHECSRCHERIAVGEFYVRAGPAFTHTKPCAAPAAEVAPAAPVDAPADSRRRNTYAGTCECGRHVAPGAGFLEFDGRWLVFCGSCGLSSTVG